jgi:hypothetical protein
VPRAWQTLCFSPPCGALDPTAAPPHPLPPLRPPPLLVPPRNGAVIKATASSGSYLNLAAAGLAPDSRPDTALSEPPGSPGSLEAPLIDKKAGLRTHGVLFLSRAKTWWAGLALMLTAASVLVVTVLTAGGGAE